MDAAEKATEYARKTTTDLATPLVNQVGGWDAIEDMAVDGLKKIETAVPVIKKPPKDVCKYVLFWSIIHSTFRCFFGSI